MMNKLGHIGIALLIGLFSCGASATPIGEAAFTKRVVERLQTLHPELQIKELRTLEIRYGIGDASAGNIAYLHNAYQAYRNGEDLSSVVETYANATVKTLEAVAPSLENIVPVIKDEGYIREVLATLDAGMSADQNRALYSTPYSDGLVILYAVDTPANIQYLTHSDFQALSIPEPELRTMAIANLNRMLPELTLHHGDGLFMITAGGNYESSILLLDTVWSHLAEKVKGSMVVGIPSRDVLMIADSANREAVDRLRETVREIHASGTYALTSDLYERLDGGWRRYVEKSPGT